MTATATDTQGKYVASVEVANGAIIITYGNEANAQIQNETLGLTPYESGDLSVMWKCGDAPVPGMGALMGTSGMSNIAVQNNGTLAGAAFQQYLPSACRP